MKRMWMTVLAAVLMAAWGSTARAAGSTAFVTGASGSPVDAQTSSVSVSIGTQSTQLVDDNYVPCRLYVNSDPGAAGGGAQTFGLSADATGWSGNVGFAPGETLYVEMAVSKDGCATTSYSNIVSVQVPAYAPPPPPPTTTTTPTTAPTTAPTTTTTAAAACDAQCTQIAALTAQIQQLNDRVSALEQQKTTLTLQTFSLKRQLKVAKAKVAKAKRR